MATNTKQLSLFDKSIVGPAAIDSLRKLSPRHVAIALDLPALVAAAGYPGTAVVPATSWILSLLALKLTGTRRVSHVARLPLTRIRELDGGGVVSLT
jgi:hypothetical protein